MTAIPMYVVSIFVITALLHCPLDRDGSPALVSFQTVFWFCDRESSENLPCFHSSFFFSVLGNPTSSNNYTSFIKVWHKTAKILPKPIQITAIIIIIVIIIILLTGKGKALDFLTCRHTFPSCLNPLGGAHSPSPRSLALPLPVVIHSPSCWTLMSVCL